MTAPLLEVSHLRVEWKMSRWGVGEPKPLFGFFLFAVLALAGTAAAQSKTLTGETQTISATVEAINVTTRTITLKGPKGNYMDIVVPEAELAERKKSWTPVKRDLGGWLARYQKLVTNASQGGILAG